MPHIMPEQGATVQPARVTPAAATVKVTRTTHQFRRSVNGAWVGNGADAATFETAESNLTRGFSLSDGITVTWPDGTSESAFPFGNNRCLVGYPPICIPRDGRLSKLLLREAA